MPIGVITLIASSIHFHVASTKHISMRSVFT